MAPDRLTELIENEQLEMACTLARAIRKKDTIHEITDAGEVICIETEHFIGTHEKTVERPREKELLDIGSDWQNTISDTGTYNLKDDHVDFEFETHTLHDNTKAYIQDFLPDKSTVAADNTAPTEERDETPPSPDTPSTPDTPSDTTQTPRWVPSVLLGLFR